MPVRMLVREMALSAGINAAISLLFFAGAFGWRRPVVLGALATDALPQSFAVALMAALVPGLVAGAARRPVAIRALLFAAAALLVGGGGQWWWLHGDTGAIAAGPALAAKMAHGAALGALVTAAALVRLFRADGPGGTATGT